MKRTHLALKHYDSFIQSLKDDPWPHVTEITALKQEAMIAALEVAVKTAFYEDTKHVNQLQDCLRLDATGPESSVRKAVIKWRNQHEDH